MPVSFLRTRIFTDTTSRSKRSDKQTCCDRWRAREHDSIHRPMEGDLENRLPVRERDANNIVSMDKDGIIGRKSPMKKTLSR
jgi:hypothetical protein